VDGVISARSPNPLDSVNETPSTTTIPCSRIGGHHWRPKLLPWRTSSSEESPGRGPRRDAVHEPEHGGVQVPARRPRPHDGGLCSGTPRARTRRRAPVRGYGGRVAGVESEGSIRCRNEGERPPALTRPDRREARRARPARGGANVVRLMVTRATCAIILKPMKRQGKEPSKF
jgi:hypothetical protein